MAARRLFLLLLPLGPLLACAGEGAPGVGTPLFDGRAQPDVLVESRRLEPPPATGGNRFLTGWRAAARGHRDLLLADPAGARVEGVSLGAGARRLVLQLVPGALPAGEVEARFGAGPSAAAGALLHVPLASRIELPLPPQLPPGRFTVDLRLPAGTPPLRGGFDRALPAGGVRVEGGDLLQGGVSLVEIVRPLAGPARLTGSFVPPKGAKDGQYFELRQRCGDVDDALWSWELSLWNQWHAPRLDLPVRCADGWLRLRFVARGAGPPARWRGLAIAGATNAPAPAPAAPASASVTAAAPPRLVLLFVFDALRADALGATLAGASATPTLDRLAGESVRFAQHFAVAPNTLPSTKALLTGHVWRQQGGVPLPKGMTTLAQRFRAAGYRTGLFSGSGYVSPAFAVDRGFETAPRDALLDEDAAAGGVHNENAAHVTAEALDWLRTLQPGERAFLYLHVIHPHNPYAPPPPFAARAVVSGASFDGSTRALLDLRHSHGPLPAGERERLRALYLANLAYGDDRLGALLAAIAQRSPPQQTLLVVTADHGEELLDHGGVLHGYTLYDEQLHIPLLLHWPGTLGARVIAARTSTVDLHAALLGLAEGARPAVALAPLLATPATGAARDPERELHLAAAASVRGGIFAARTARYKVVWAPRTGVQWGMGEGLGRARDAEFVFDLVADPAERHNLAGAQIPEVLWLRERLLAWAAGREREPAGEAAADAETLQRLKALGYVE